MKYDLVCQYFSRNLSSHDACDSACMKKSYYITGILKEKEEVVKEAIKKSGLTVEEVTYQGDWCSITAKKN